MFFNEISQGELVNIIEQMESKSSLDINGLSTKLIKFLKPRHMPDKPRHMPDETSPHA